MGTSTGVRRGGRRHPRTSGRRVRWSELSGRTRTAVVVLGTIETVLTAVAAVDLYRRPRDGVRGPKALWWPAIFVQPIGPVAYLATGRRPDRPPEVVNR
jgi:Phospholipase_D-nuclease N-terminal